MLTNLKAEVYSVRLFFLSSFGAEPNVTCHHILRLALILTSLFCNFDVMHRQCWGNSKYQRGNEGLGYHGPSCQRMR